MRMEIGIIIGIIIGIFLGVISWHIGLLRMEARQKKGGCYRHCERCGHLYDYPLTFVLKKKLWA